MARTRPTELASRRFHRTLNTPGPFLRGMLVFLMVVALCGAILYQPLELAFWANPVLNGLILGVLAIGILRAFGQVVRLYPEIRWVNAFRIADPGLAIDHKPVLLAPMATMLRDRTGQLSLSTSSMRSIMDSIGGRLDEARDTNRRNEDIGLARDAGEIGGAAVAERNRGVAVLGSQVRTLGGQ